MEPIPAPMKPMPMGVRIMVISVVVIIAGALLVGITILLQPSEPYRDCHWDYEHSYLLRDTGYDVGERQYCKGWEEAVDMLVELERDK